MMFRCSGSWELWICIYLRCRKSDFLSPIPVDWIQKFKSSWSLIGAVFKMLRSFPLERWISRALWSLNIRIRMRSLWWMIRIRTAMINQELGYCTLLSSDHFFLSSHLMPCCDFHLFNSLLSQRTEGSVACRTSYKNASTASFFASALI
jgi:hypothetical protein